MAGKQPSLDPISPKKRAGTPVFMPNQPSKRKRAAVRRSENSPKTAVSPRCVASHEDVTTNSLIKRIAPTVIGMEAGARYMCQENQVVALPTETVYMLCTTMNVKDMDTNDGVQRLKQVHSSFPRRPLVILESAQQLDTLLPQRKTTYAIRLLNGKATPPVRLDESRQVLEKLATKYWPGPIQIYKSVDEKDTHVPSLLLQDAPFATTTTESPSNTNNTTQYLPLSCPSHPLMARFLTQVSCHNKKAQVMIGTPTYSTSAKQVCDQYHNSQNLHVLHGEEQREVFSVPTCAYGRECAISLYIDASRRIIYIVGSKEETMVPVSPSIITKTLRRLENPRNVKQRVLCAVLKKWKVLDRRI